MNSSDPTDDQVATTEDAAQASEEIAKPQPEQEQKRYERTRVSGVWIGLIVAAVVMVFLLIFILQNQESADIDFLGFHFSLPLGVALLMAALSGVVIVAIPGVARIVQLRRKLRS